MSEVTLPSMEELLEAGVHFGHTTSRWHPKMKSFLYGKRGGVHIIDLAKTREKLAEAVVAVAKTAASGKAVLFVGVKPLAKTAVVEEAVRSGSPFMVNRWIGGTLTNWPAVNGMIKRMKQLEDDQAAGKLDKYTKKEQLDFMQEREDLKEVVGGLRDLKGAPSLLFIVDAKYDKTALSEANKLKIPVVAICDSNINPGKITYPIPANDDALKSINLISRIIADAVIVGKEKAKAIATEAAVKP
ncbi:MAG: 30S ribosomal protein S2 [Candidatus Komeilibacteria bacterium RIFCSPLOWO2_02_FULL_48_11]|uniref:Small ribosomal subunit protein uS2 n=1 Tax=Candidatus Komeilibacteria bacterium RIFCSPLOWO2_02_FULL_48_11 TaxID=1798553 RepID=A0A1G2BT21_9BACT|nr:MAG: 30S ribosomal protein S2 [Candidatus Komeilibacteria bacterium RIFCSPLOWO2_02_FULL_48_11]